MVSNALRRFSQPIMIVVTILVIISFVCFFQGPIFARRLEGQDVFKIYGKGVTMDQLDHLKRKLGIFSALGNGYFEAMMPQRTMFQQENSQDPNDNPVINSLVFEHEADALGLGATGDEITALILEKTEAFKTDGKFDPSIYNNFVQNALTPNGYTEDSLIKDFARSEVRLEKLQNLLAATVSPTPGEIRTKFEELNRQTDCSYVKVKTSELPPATVTEEEIKKRFEETKDSLKTEEKRKVRFAGFKIENQAKPLVGKERTEALQPLVNKTAEMAKALREKDANFDEVAKKFGALVGETPDFTRQDLPAELDANSQAVQSAYQLTKDKPLSNVVITDKGSYILQLDHILEPQPKSYEDAKSQIEGQLKEQKGNDAARVKADELRTKIDEQLKAGKTFVEAAEAAGAKAVKFDRFCLKDFQDRSRKTSEDDNTIIGLVMELAVGDLSAARQVRDGVIIAHVDERPPLDESKFEQDKKGLVEEVRGERSKNVFHAWLKDRRAESGITSDEQKAAEKKAEEKKAGEKKPEEKKPA